MHPSNHDLDAVAFHAYRSTACLHNWHEACRKYCKWCEEPCRCDCHQPKRAKNV